MPFSRVASSDILFEYALFRRHGRGGFRKQPNEFLPGHGSPREPPPLRASFTGQVIVNPQSGYRQPCQCAGRGPQIHWPASRLVRMRNASALFTRWWDHKFGSFEQRRGVDLAAGARLAGFHRLASPGLRDFEKLSQEGGGGCGSSRRAHPCRSWCGRAVHQLRSVAASGFDLVVERSRAGG